MDALSNVTGLKDLIASYVPISKLPNLGNASLKWEAPAKDAALYKLISKILTFQECVSGWVSFRNLDSWYGVCNNVRTSEASDILLDFIKKNKRGGVNKFKELKKQFLEQVKIEEWKSLDPRCKHPTLREHNLIIVIHKQGARLFDFRIKIENTKQEIISLIQFLFPKEIKHADKKLDSFTSSTPKTMFKYLLKIIRHLPSKISNDILEKLPDN